ncbi:hypothetical protein G6F56_005548 [Rhizopus delemar]|nr:hypothetical protein G6F56_005548 [Rhizopus delemar]
MASERISQFLPTVKCSDCGKGVEIHRLGDHICSTSHTPQNASNPVFPPVQSPNKMKRSEFNSPPTPPLVKDVFSNDLYNPSFRNNYNNNEPIHDTRYGTRDPSPGDIYQQINGSGALDNLMADLMSSMNSDAPPSAPPSLNSNTCHSCGEEFDYRDDVKTVDNQCYHKACFVCRLCCEPFEQRSTYYEHEGKFYCERDYRVVKNRLMCSACDKKISPNTTPIKVLGKAYHQGHIKCYHCYNPIDDNTGWKEYQGKVYCKEDFRSLFIPKCRACDKPVEKEAVSAMDGKLQGKWHLDCFGCHTCHRPFPDNTFYVFEDSPYCMRHYHQLNNSLCRTCDEPIEGPCAQTIEGWRFHPACFGCNICHYPITDIYYMFERKIYCETHIRKLQAQRNVRAEKRKTQFGRI